MPIYLLLDHEAAAVETDVIAEGQVDRTTIVAEEAVQTEPTQETVLVLKVLVVKENHRETAHA